MQSDNPTSARIVKAQIEKTTLGYNIHAVCMYVCMYVCIMDCVHMYVCRGGVYIHKGD